MQQGRYKECASLGIGINETSGIGVADHSCFRLKVGYPRADLVQLSAAGERAHLHRVVGRVAHNHAFQRGRQGANNVCSQGLGNDDPANRRALLTRLARHLASHFPNEEVEFRGPRPGVHAEYRRVQRIGLCSEAHRFRHNASMRLQQFRGRLGPGERDDVLAIEVIEQVTDTAADQLQRPVRQQAGIDYASHHALRQVGRARRRFYDCGDAGQ